jgi:hypothetical protein
MVGEPEALPQEVVDEHARLDLGLASHPFTVHAMHLQEPPPPSLRLDSLARLLASRPARRTLGRWWLLSCTCILGREGRDVQAFGASDGLGNGEEYSGRRTWLGFLACR